MRQGSRKHAQERAGSRVNSAQLEVAGGALLRVQAGQIPLESCTTGMFLKSHVRTTFW